MEVCVLRHLASSAGTATATVVLLGQMKHLHDGVQIWCWVRRSGSECPTSSRRGSMGFRSGSTTSNREEDLHLSATGSMSEVGSSVELKSTVSPSQTSLNVTSHINFEYLDSRAEFLHAGRRCSWVCVRCETAHKPSDDLTSHQTPKHRVSSNDFF